METKFQTNEKALRDYVKQYNLQWCSVPAPHNAVLMINVAGTAPFEIYVSKNRIFLKYIPEGGEVSWNVLCDSKGIVKEVEREFRVSLVNNR